MAQLFKLHVMRVLVVTPHFPPTNGADMQRVRLVLPYLREHGIEAEVLCVESSQVAAPQDPWLAAGLSKEIQVHRVTALSLEWSRIPGLGTLGFRAVRALGRAGDELFKAHDFDLVYFSTTVFGVHVLGPRWKKKFGVPFVMDYQDPWVSDYYREHPEVVPPGGRLKYGLASWINRRQEPRVLRECSGITSVSAAYLEQLAKRYEWLKVVETGGLKPETGRRKPAIVPDIPPLKSQVSAFMSQLFSTVLPFPGDARDFERVKQEGIRQTVFDPNDGLKHWVYVGVCPPSMVLAVRSLFSALRATINHQPSTLNSLRLHFIGTSYAAAGTGVKIVEPLAAEYGLSDIVHESTDRIPYSETLRCLLDADALIIPGSDDPGYTASKIYPYLLAGKPLLAVFHEQSSVVDLIRKVGGGTVIGFATGEAPEAIAARIACKWLATGGPEQAVPLDQAAFAPYTAREQAMQLAGFFLTIGRADPARSADFPIYCG